MSNGSDAYWAAGFDADAVATQLKGQLFEAADEVLRKSRAVVDHERAGGANSDVIQAAMIWGTVAATVAAGARSIEPRDDIGQPETGLYPGEAWLPTTIVPVDGR
jgi:hypothetical protein